MMSPCSAAPKSLRLARDRILDERRPFVIASLVLASLFTAPAEGAVQLKQNHTAPQISPAEAPSWVRFLGWSARGHTLAWRQGDKESRNRVGAPCWISRVDKKGALLDPTLISTKVGQSLHRRRIYRRQKITMERVSPRDTLLRTSKGKLLAVVLRDDPAIVAILMRRKGEYFLINSRALKAPARSLRVRAYETRDRQMLAVSVSALGAGSRQGLLMVVPLIAPAPKNKTPRAP